MDDHVGGTNNGTVCSITFNFSRAINIAFVWCWYLCSRVLTCFGVNVIWMIEVDRDTILLFIVRGNNGRSISVSPLDHDRIARFEAYILEERVRAVEDGFVAQIDGLVLTQ